MTNIDTIERISGADSRLNTDISSFGAAVVMVGSFVPIHDGHRCNYFSKTCANR